ncbi:transposase [Dehalococcoidia bacterium]|nr:transposase [Dehalococcoidia bacterium]
MARQLRIEYEGALYHITSRGNQRGQIFWHDGDKVEFNSILKKTKERYSYLLHAYVLMDNHYHLLIETPYANIKQVMQNINTSYSVYVNRKYQRVGHLFQGRYKAFIVDNEGYLLELSRYLHLNPVRAKIVEKPQDYRWSSYGDYADGGRRDSIADTDDTLRYFSNRQAIAIQKYREFVEAGIGGKSPLEGAKGSILGDETFRQEVIKHLNHIIDQTEVPDIKRIMVRHPIEDIVKTVADYYGIEEREILKRKKSTARRRTIAIYLSKILSGKKNVEVGGRFGVTIQAVTNAVKRIERAMEEDKELSREIAMMRRKVEE